MSLLSAIQLIDVITTIIFLRVIMYEYCNAQEMIFSNELAHMYNQS